MTQPTATRSVWIRWQLIAAAVVYVLDAWVLGQGGIAIVALIAAIVGGVMAVVRGLGGDRHRVRQGLATIGLFVATLLAVVATNIQHQAMSERRAPLVIEAIGKYRDAHATYPAKLQDLVPEQMPSVPRARYTLLFGNFEYMFKRADTPLLMFYAVPPMGRRVYDVGGILPPPKNQHDTGEGPDQQPGGHQHGGHDMHGH